MLNFALLVNFSQKSLCRATFALARWSTPSNRRSRSWCFAYQDDSDFDDDFSDDDPLSPPTGALCRRVRSSPKSPTARGRSPFPKVSSWVSGVARYRVSRRV